MKWFVTSNKGERELDLPDSWETLTVDLYQKIHKEWDRVDLIKLFSILSGLSFKTISESKDRDLELHLRASTSFIYDQEPTFKDKPFPKEFTFKGITITLPKDVTGLSIGQNIMVLERMEGQTFDELISWATAIYLQPLIDRSEFNAERAIEIEQEILQMPITEIYPIGFFLLKPLMKLGKAMKNRRNRLLTRWFKGFMKRGITYLRLRKSNA